MLRLRVQRDEGVELLPAEQHALLAQQRVQGLSQGPGHGGGDHHDGADQPGAVRADLQAVPLAYRLRGRGNADRRDGGSQIQHSRCRNEDTLSWRQHRSFEADADGRSAAVRGLPREPAHLGRNLREEQDGGDGDEQGRQRVEQPARAVQSQYFVNLHSTPCTTKTTTGSQGGMHQRWPALVAAAHGGSLTCR